MLRLRRSSLVLLVCFLTASPALAQSGSHAGSGLTRQNQLRQQGLTRAWWGQAVMDYQRDKLRHLTTDGDHVFAQCTNGIITAFDAESGRKLWSNRIGDTDAPQMPASTNDEHLLVWSAATMYLLNKDNGQKELQFKLPGQPSTSARSDKEQIYVGFLDGSLYAFDLKTGTINWRFRTSRRIVVPALPHSHTVLFASTNGSLYSVDALTRDLVFQFEADNVISAPMGLYKDWVLLPSEDYKLYAVNINNGEEGWKAPFLSGERIRKAPVVIDDEIYVIPEHRGLFQLAAETGVERWYVRGITEVLAVSPTKVFAVDKLERLVVLDRKSGKKTGGVPLGPATVLMTNTDTDRIYLATPQGTVICLHEVDRDLPFFHKEAEDRPFMPPISPEPDAVGLKQ